MKGKGLLLVGVLMAMQVSVASSEEWYVGTGLGYGMGTNKVTGDFRDLRTDSKKMSAVTQGFQGQIYGGWGTKWDQKKIYSGIELAADFIPMNHRERQRIATNASSEMTLSHRFGLSLMAKQGLVFDHNKIAYLKAGFGLRRFVLGTTTDTLNAARQIVPQNASRSSNLFGVKVAVGAEAEVIQGVYAGFEYGYARYQKMSLQKTTSTGAHFSYQVEPSMNTFMLTLTRKF